MIKPESPLGTGRWMVTQETGQYTLQQVLVCLDGVQQWLIKRDWHPERIQISINSALKKNSYFFQENSLYLELRDGRQLNTMDSISDRSGKPSVTIFFPPVKKILLLFPTLPTDRRWDTLSLPAADLFLGSALLNHHFQVKIEKLDLRFAPMRPDWQEYDVIGITLYEDLFPETSRWLSQLSQHFNGLIAAGGPMVTLNPLESLFHAPQVNLLIRGESEFIFPEILKAINQNSLDQLLDNRGFMFHHRNLVILSELHHVNRPEDLKAFRFDTRLLEDDHLRCGIEINLSRGCNQGCIFCSKIQGKQIRKLPVREFDRLLNNFARLLKVRSLDFPHSRTININDDNILQDPGYVEKVFKSIKKQGFKLWGVQTSLQSLFNTNRAINRGLVELISDPQLFVNNRPLVWLGTDAFLKIRGKKLGKWIPDRASLEKLLHNFESHKIKNFHYWISSDYASDWQEFLEEFLLIIDLKTRFPHFELLAHSPFLIPYSSTPLYRILYRDPDQKSRIIYRDILKSSSKSFVFPLPARVETRYNHLNGLLKNQSERFLPGFFDHLKQGQYIAALKTAYHFLRQERMGMEDLKMQNQAEGLKELESCLEERLSFMIR